MADNVPVRSVAGGTPVATDDVDGVQYQKVKLDVGGDGVSVPVVGSLPVSDNGGSLTVDGSVSVSNFPATQPVSAVSLPLPSGAATAANQSSEQTLVGALTETPPTDDTASSGLNGRLQRVAQRLTSLIALLPVSVGQKNMAGSLAVTVASDQSAVPVSGTVSVNALPAGNNNIGDVDVVTLPGVAGTAAHDAVASGNPVSIGGVSSTTVPTAVNADGDSVRLWADRNGALFIVGRGFGGSVLQTNVTVGTTAVALPSSVLSGRKSIEVQNEGLYDIFVGGSTVTTTGATRGRRIRPGDSWSHDIGSAVLYAISANAGQEVIVLEFS